MKRGNDCIDLNGVVSQPVVDKDGKVLNDLELMKKGLERIDEYQEKNKEVPPIAPKFVQFMREMVDDVKQGNSTIEQYKNMHIAKEYIDKINFKGAN